MEKSQNLNKDQIEEAQKDGALIEGMNQINRMFTESQLRALFTLFWNTDKVMELKTEITKIKETLRKK